MIATKVIVIKNGERIPALYISNIGKQEESFSLFLNSAGGIIFNVERFEYISNTPILKF